MIYSIEKQLYNITKLYEQIKDGEVIEISKSTLESFCQILRELKEYKDTGLTPEEINELSK